MSKAATYNFQFVVLVVYRKIPWIEPGVDSAGFSLHYDMAEFIRTCSVDLCQLIIQDINDLNLSTASPPLVDHRIDGHYEEFVELSSPDTASFPDTNGGSNDYPVQDLLDLLQEWADFLNSKCL
jgi:hypothetical protein